MNKNEGRFAAIFLGIAAPLGFWISMEYLNQPPAALPQHPTEAPRAAGAQQAHASAEATADAVQSSAMTRQLEEPATGGIFRCRQGAQIIYTDRPAQQCGHDSVATQLAPAPARAGIAPDKPYQQQLAELEQAQARARVLAVSDQGNEARRNAERAAHDQLCRNLDEEIRWLDSVLRQPHDAHMGDLWTEKRRNATGRHYSEHC